MQKLDFDNNQGPVAALTLIVALNVILMISFLSVNIGGTGFLLTGIQISVLVGLELAGVIFAYAVYKRRNTTVPL